MSILKNQSLCKKSKRFPDFSPYKIILIAQENKYLGIFFLFHHGIVCCVYSLESPHRGHSNEYTQQPIIV